MDRVGDAVMRRSWSLLVWLLAATPAAQQASPTCQFQDGMVDHALQRNATASPFSLQEASNAIDGDDRTRWESGHSRCGTKECFEQYIEVDLGSMQTLCAVSILWHSAFASLYELQTSRDGATWTTVRTVDDSFSSGTHFTTSGLPIGTTAHYLRVYCLQRALHPKYGYSIFTLQILGAAAPSQTKRSRPRARKSRC